MPRSRQPGHRVRRRHLGSSPYWDIRSGRRRRPQRSLTLLRVAQAARARGTLSADETPRSARYLAERMSTGDSSRARRRSLEELDGVFTYMCVTRDALGVGRTSWREAVGPLRVRRLVAMASGRSHPGGLNREIATTIPDEGEVLVWSRCTPPGHQLRRPGSPSRRRRSPSRDACDRAVFDASELHTPST